MYISHQTIRDGGFIFEIHTRVSACDAWWWILVRFRLWRECDPDRGQLFPGRDRTTRRMQIGCSNTDPICGAGRNVHMCDHVCHPSRCRLASFIEQPGREREFIIRGPRANRSRAPLAHVYAHYTDVSRIDYRSVARTSSRLSRMMK